MDMTQRPFTLLNRFLQFRAELGQLWRAFRAAETPMHLKVLMLLVPLYLLSPIDLIPDFIPLAGWLDDYGIRFIGQPDFGLPAAVRSSFALR